LDWVETKIVESDLISFSSFGFDVAIDACGNTLCVGQLSYNYEWEVTDGANYTYEYDGSNWILIHKFADSYENGDLYGFSTALSRDGTYLSVGAPNYDTENGTCHVYKLSCFGRTSVCIPMNFESSSSQSPSSVSESSPSSTSESSPSSASTSSSSSSISSLSSLSSPSSLSNSSVSSVSSLSIDVPSDSSTSVSVTSVSAGGPTFPYIDCTYCPQATIDNGPSVTPDGAWSYVDGSNWILEYGIDETDPTQHNYSGSFQIDNICFENYTGESFYFDQSGLTVDLTLTYDGLNLYISYNIYLTPSSDYDGNYYDVMLTNLCNGHTVELTVGGANRTGGFYDLNFFVGVI
jgi:hypothetical protein